MAPGVGAEGVDEFVLREVKRLDDGLAEIGESGGGLGVDLTLGDSGEQARQRGRNIAGGDVLARQAMGDLPGSVVSGESLRFLAGVVAAEAGVPVRARHAAAAAVSESEGAGGRARFRAMSGHRNSLSKLARRWDRELVQGFADRAQFKDRVRFSSFEAQGKPFEPQGKPGGREADSSGRPAKPGKKRPRNDKHAGREPNQERRDIPREARADLSTKELYQGVTALSRGKLDGTRV